MPSINASNFASAASGPAARARQNSRFASLSEENATSIRPINSLIASLALFSASDHDSYGAVATSFPANASTSLPT